MMNRIFVFVAFLLFSCNPKISKDNLAMINGYWEIEKVVLEDGTSKDYTINESFDYFQTGKNDSGFRKKVMPQLDGSFIVNNTQEAFQFRFDKESVFLDYKTSYASWSEELIALNEVEMVFLTADKKEYHYKKATPIHILGDGKKTK